MNNTPNPLMPQGSLQEQSKRKSQVHLIVFSILAIHVVLLGALLIQGCRREEPLPQPDLPPPPTNLTDILPEPPPTDMILPPPPTNVAVLPPPPPPPVVEIPPAAPTEHVIQKGESFYLLAKQYGVSVKAIQQANPGVDPSRLKIGQKITIPPKPPGGATSAGPASPTSGVDTAPAESVYTVKAGDNLTKIASRHGVSVKALRTFNNLRTDQIRVGQKLRIPPKTGADASSATPVLTAPPPPPPPPTSAPALPANPSSP